MQTRTDQAQAYRFTTRRIVSALLSGEPETAERPMRRFGMALFGSIMVAAIVFAAVGIVGFLFPSGAKLKNKDLVLDKDTGAVYIFEGGVLYPVRNFTSARLALGSEKPNIAKASAKSLRGFPRGPLIGIPDLPDSLPEPKALVTGAWSVCSRSQHKGSSTLETDLVVGGLRPGGVALGANAMILRRAATEGVQYFLALQGRRLLIDNNGITALGLKGKKIDVSPGLLNAVPQGPNLAPPSTYKRGGFGRDIDGSPGIIGDVYQEPASGSIFVLVEGGLKKIGPVMRNLLLQAGARPHDISLAAVGTPTDTRPFEETGFPQTIPGESPVTSPEMVCAVTAPVRNKDDSGIETYAYAGYPDTSLLRRVPGSGETGTGAVQTAEFVQMVGGEAALVKSSPAPGDNTLVLTTYLVTQGYKFALASEEVKTILGYGGVEPPLVPSNMLALLPDGNELDPKAAGVPADLTEGAGPGVAPGAGTSAPPSPSTTGEPSADPDAQPAAENGTTG
jgi:type VII secretion protein EccB